MWELLDEAMRALSPYGWTLHIAFCLTAIEGDTAVQEL